MKKIGLTFTVLALLVHCSFVYADIELVENKPHWQAQVFIANQIKGIGLVDSYQEDNSDESFVYDNALAAIASMAMGNFGLAKEILDTLSNEVLKTDKGVPFESYSYLDGRGYRLVAYCGNSAWLLQAFNIYQKLRSSRIYYAAQEKLADFLFKLQDSNDGALWGMHEDDRREPQDWFKSVEHNIAAYAALRNFGRLNKLPLYVDAAKRIKVFLKGPSVWDGTRFNRGADDVTKVTDVQALGVLVLSRAAYASALGWAEDTLRLSKTYKPEQPDVIGFDFNDDLDTVWLEGTLQMALAFYKSDNILKGDFYYNEALKTRQDDGAVIQATNTGTTGINNWLLRPWRAIAPTSWLIFYHLKFNPLILY